MHSWFSTLLKRRTHAFGLGGLELLAPDPHDVNSMVYDTRNKSHVHVIARCSFLPLERWKPMRLALQLEHCRSLGEPRRDFDLEWNGPPVDIAGHVSVPIPLKYQACTYTTRPSSTHPSTSIGIGLPCAFMAGSMFIAQRTIAISMNNELFATCLPTQIRLPKPYVKCPSSLESVGPGAI